MKIDQVEFIDTGKSKKRLLCNGFNYIEDGGKNKVNNKIYWKCAESSCKARVWTTGYQSPALVRKYHNHLPNFERNQLYKSEFITKNKIKNSHTETRELYIEHHKNHSKEVVAQSKTYDAFRREACRARNKECDWYGAAPKDYNFEIPEELKKNFKGDNFYLDDSGTDDPKHILFINFKVYIIAIAENIAII